MPASLNGGASRVASLTPLEVPLPEDDPLLLPLLPLEVPLDEDELLPASAKP